MNQFTADLHLAMKAGVPIIFVVSEEISTIAIEIVRECVNEGVVKESDQIKVWTVTTGWNGDGRNDPTEVPVAIDEFPPNTICVLQNFHWYLGENASPTLVQAFIDGHSVWKGNFPKSVIIVSPFYKVAPELDRLVYVINHQMPSSEELTQTLKSIVEDEGNKDNVPSLTPEEIDDVVKAGMGLTKDEFETAVSISIMDNPEFRPSSDSVMKTKTRTITKSGYLEFWPYSDDLSGVGGMNNLKDWLKKREKGLTLQAREFGLPYPKGLLLLGVPGCGKCHGKDTPILMYDGTVKMVQDVYIGDKLMGDDGTPRNVMATNHGIGDLYQVIPTQGSPFVVNGDHILSIKRLVHDKEHTINISVSDWLSTTQAFKDRTKIYRVGVDWAEQNVPINPYFLGVWLGDGSSSHPLINMGDNEILDFVKSYALELSLTANDAPPNRTIPHLDISTHLINEMRKLNILHNKHIPLCYLVNSREVRLQVLAGLIDANGYVNSMRNGIEISTKSLQLRDNILFLARSLGFAAYGKECPSRYKKDGIIRNTGTYHRITISGELSNIPTRVPRKQIKLPRQQVKNVLRTGMRIEPIGVGDYYGFTLDGNSLYCLGDFTVTHNSLLAKCIAKQWGLPLVRFDLGKVFASLVGESEQRMRAILRLIEALSPVIIWVDEIEKGLAGAKSATSTDSGVTKRIFGTLISWMQDRPKDKLVYIIMTANDVLSLPPELLRKGRLDEIFWVDLPNHQERLEILNIHLSKRNQLSTSLKKELDSISKLPSLEGFSGAEIENVIENAMFDVFYENRKTITRKDLEQSIASVVPLSRTRSIEIDEMRRWAVERCKPAQIPDVIQVQPKTTRRKLNF